MSDLSENNGASERLRITIERPAETCLMLASAEKVYHIYVLISCVSAGSYMLCAEQLYWLN